MMGELPGWVGDRRTGGWVVGRRVKTSLNQSSWGNDFCRVERGGFLGQVSGEGVKVGEGGYVKHFAGRCSV